MSRRSGIPHSREELQGYYEPVNATWTGVETPAYQTSFMGVPPSPYCTEPIVPHPAILTPISLPDSSFRPSPALSHHSQEYATQDYQYNINDQIQPQGLGITAQFPSEYPRTTAPVANYAYAPTDIPYGMGYTPNMSPLAPAPKRMKRTSSDMRTPSRDTRTPLSILPDPEGVERLERERSQSTPAPAPMPPKPRAPGRGRRDPNAEEEDAFVEDLREQNVSWKRVRQMFFERFNQDASEARLQMRLNRRLKLKQHARWDEKDVQLLLSASDMWEIERSQFIAEKMKELGSTKGYTPDQCKAKLRHLEAKQRHATSGSTSPSEISDRGESPLNPPPTSRKRARQEFED
ncbi:uncharacterized protein N7473_007589 [Penicillium subrubescens]|uniref:Myb-like domain-containing protein n=1 Tax=Penicillium subrubescens TaxID=1316194 RepID=A0A1Q5UQU2_9EURO|nr:uncharacterized protein N7473_007589 [Penicillium subrubescens]KAJ5891361.1 hypothetical protein N7473_007589 [Penicillium subrubescens]OKP14848.1 hypothetical protein PENSUB_5912 [Penicillium subrubescens]